MTSWETPNREERRPQRRKTPSFSSSLLDAIYHSIDESQGKVEEQNPGFHHRKRTNAPEIEEEIASLRRAIMVEKWMGNHTTSSRSSNSRHTTSDSSSSTDSSFFSSSETESASKSTPKSSAFRQNLVSEATPKHEGRFMRTKSRALKIYGDLKKVKQPISPGGKIANFLNSIFSSRNLKKHEGIEDWSSVRKSRSVKDSFSGRSCLNGPMPPPSSKVSKSKRSVKFCPVSIILDEDCQPCGHKIIYDEDFDSSLTPIPKINSHFLKKNIDSFRNYEEKKSKKYEFMGYYQDDSDDDDGGNSCTSSDLFELENIGIVGISHGAHREELPVYGTTNLKINQAIANGLVM